MVKIAEIERISMAYSQWKKGFLNAISSQQPNLEPEVIKRDDECQFGKWLHGLPPEDMQSEHYTTVKALHSDFHKSAGEIAELVMSGKRDEALKRIEGSDQLSNITGRLSLALRIWQSKL